MKKILVIDDAEFILESTAALLGFEGYEVITASDGVLGLEQAFAHHPDLILCDISMPNLDGYGVVEELRKHEKTLTTPFIFLTAFTEKSNMRLGMEKGADDFLVKPYTKEELVAAIDAQWKKHSNIEKQVQEKVDVVGKNVTYALPHEFRTVLNQVVGSARFLQANPSQISAEEITELSNDIIDSAKRLLKITENFLIYVRIESIMSNAEKRRQLLNDRTDEPCAVLYDIATTTAYNLDRGDDLDIGNLMEQITLRMSSETFHKVINEIIDNACKFSQKGTKIRVNTWLEGGLLYVTVQDKGRGMTKEQVNGVGAYVQFERKIYEQQGVGLGLVIAKRFTELHEGKFFIESEEGLGTKIMMGFQYLKL